MHYFHYFYQHRAVFFLNFQNQNEVYRTFVCETGEKYKWKTHKIPLIDFKTKKSLTSIRTYRLSKSFSDFEYVIDDDGIAASFVLHSCTRIDLVTNEQNQKKILPKISIPSIHCIPFGLWPLKFAFGFWFLCQLHAIFS